jgi:putative SOS response-associated peptidase YedK
MSQHQASIQDDFAPTERVLVVRQDPETNQRESVWLRWGLVPSWAKIPDTGNPLIHARAETVATKPAFREAFRYRRCQIVADSFALSGRRKRLAIQMKDHRPFGVGGIWERWQREEQESIESCAIITVPANDLVRPINDRMPLIVAQQDYDEWLDLSVQEPELLEGLLVPCPAEEMVVVPA